MKIEPLSLIMALEILFVICCFDVLQNNSHTLKSFNVKNVNAKKSLTGVKEHVTKHQILAGTN